jgi:beta-glucuronidase
MRRALVALLLAAFAAPAAADPPEAIQLDQGWQRSFDHADWSDVSVPDVFDATPDPEDFEGKVGWYRLTFDGPQAPDGYDWALRFEEVRRIAEVRLNGEVIGTHEDPYLPFEVDATTLRPGEPNSLEVRVDARKEPDIPREGWWNWGGMVRPVKLIPKGRVEMEDGAVLTKDLGDGRATMLFDGWARNRTSGTLSGEVAVSLRAPGNGERTRASGEFRDLAPGERRRVTFEFTVDDPQTWAPDHPSLYEQVVETRVDGRIEQRDETRAGIRTIRTVDGVLELNGRPVELSGASIHEDIEGHGPALTDDDIKTIVAELKALHANVTRSHYLLDERLLRALDEAGILVWNQVPVYHRDRMLITPEERRLALDQLAGTILNARQHPSVMTHSVANELSVVPDEVPYVATYVDAARRLASDLDPTLPPSIDLLSYPGYPRAETYARFPLLGINSYFGWYRGKENHRVDDIDDFGPYLERVSAQYPDAAKVVTEFGAEATMDGPAEKKQTYAFQADYVRRSLEIIRAAPDISGAIYWTLREFAVKPLWDGGAELEEIQTDSIHNKGLISYGGDKKPAWDVAEREFASTPLYVDASALPEPAGGPLGIALLLLVPFAVFLLLALAARAARDIWRLTRPPGGAQVVDFPSRRAA